MTARSPLWLVLLAFFVVPTLPAWGAEPLRLAGNPVDFAFWAPREASYAYQDLALSDERRATFVEAEHPYIKRLHKVQLDLLPDGRVEETITLSRYFFTHAGAQESGNQGLWVDSFNQVTTILEAYTLLPGGQRIEVEPGTLQLTADSTDDIFSDSFYLTVPFPRLMPNAVSVLVVQLVHDTKALPIPWSSGYFPQSFSPSEEFDLVMTWQEDSIQPAWDSDLDSLDCEITKPRRLHCRATNLPATPYESDVNYYDVVPTLTIAAQKSWDELTRQVRNVVTAEIGTDDFLDSVLPGLLEGSDSEEEKLDRIHRFASQEIRYVGLEHGVGGIVPRSPTSTYKRRYGDCKDKTVLFIDLARRAGIDAYPVLTSTYRNDLEKLLLPASNYFNHMIACAVLSDDREYCLDLTDSYSPYDRLSYGVQGAISLDLRSDKGEPKRLPDTQYLREMEVVSSFHHTKEGTLLNKETRTFIGDYATAVRASLLARTQDERQLWALEDYQSNITNSVTPEFRFEGITEVSEPVSLFSEAEFDAAGTDGEYEHGEAESWLNYEIQRSRTLNKVFDYEFDGLRYRGENTFWLRDGQRADFHGPTLDFDSRFGTMRRSYEIRDGHVKVVTKVSLPRNIYTPEDLPEFHKYLDLIQDHTRVWFSVKGS